MISLALFLLAQSTLQNRPTPPPVAREVEGPIELVELSPPFRQHFSCAEHAVGELPLAGDALGTDCVIIGGIDEHGNGFARPFRTDGRTNSDWYGWHEDVLAPFDGVVDAVIANNTVNDPGTMGRPPAGILRFIREDGTAVVYGHVDDIQVKPGERVTAGQVVAKVGNNGVSRSPHIHVGAYRGDVPLQIRWDLRAMARLQTSP